MISGASGHLDGGKGPKPAPIRTEGYCLMASSAWMRKPFWKQAVRAGERLDLTACLYRFPGLSGGGRRSVRDGDQLVRITVYDSGTEPLD